MIEKLFTSKNRVKIMGFILFEKSESYTREIARKIKISVSAVKRELDNLQEIGILKSNNGKIALNKNCSFLNDVKNIFIKTDFIAYPLKEALINKKIKFALIFGSFANGNYQEESDVDLLIIGNIKLSEAYSLIKPAEEKIKREINPVVWTIDNLNREKDRGFARDIFKKKIIMIIGDENEFRKIIK